MSIITLQLKSTGIEKIPWPKYTLKVYVKILMNHRFARLIENGPKSPKDL